ncbi:Crp/Fnr family transcriptional regulator [Streptomyces odontomachi]|uniref:Crp/Fnr family transcriptional regulator n=1 Tax=Streptomyces odontomachi TaxID=2944940 RepID=UPI00210DE729|nr:Crp/Fnr family transcriptional regulator [Streptomyces sp. ODS25]
MSADPEDWPAASFVADLDPVLRREVLRLGAERRYARGDVLLRQGDSGRSVMVLIDGLTKVSSLSASGDELLLSLRTRGDLLGELGFVTGSPRSALVVAATSVRARVIPAAGFAAFLRQHPEQAMRVSAVVARKLQRANERRAEYQSMTAKKRVAAVLVDVIEMIGDETDAGPRIGPELTQADLASLAVVSLRTVEQLLQDFEQERLLERRRRYLIITGAARLREIAGR